ncbi:MAG TPA: 5-dehydro-2-deoxygluconokinase, partial [Streptomyces sp.]|nr:5-dehydro-2-deoxygluconokinase [Streptomyces sp.]
CSSAMPFPHEVERALADGAVPEAVAPARATGPSGAAR